MYIRHKNGDRKKVSENLRKLHKRYDMLVVNEIEINPRLLVRPTLTTPLYIRFKTRNEFPVTHEESKAFIENCDRNLAAFSKIDQAMHFAAEVLKIPKHKRK